MDQVLYQILRLNSNVSSFIFHYSYISALTDDSEPQNLETAVSLGWPASLHLIGKV